MIDGLPNEAQADHMIDIARRLTETVRSEVIDLGLDADSVTVATLINALGMEMARQIGADAGRVRIAEGIYLIQEFVQENIIASIQSLRAKAKRKS